MPSFNCSRLGILLSLFLVACIASPSFAETLTLRPVADTTLFQSDPTNNLGGELTVAVGRTDTELTNGLVAVNRGLFKFDLAGAIPSNAIITAASLGVTVVQVPSIGRVDSIFSLRRMLRSWGEGNKRSTNTFKNGSLATAGEATWIHRSYPDALWGVSGAGGSADAANGISATNFVRGSGTYTFNSTASLVSDVQFWLNNPGSNFGWIMRSENEGANFTNRRFASREDTNAAPRLTIEFSLTQASLRFDRVTRIGTNVQLQFTAEADKSYALEFRAALNAGNWLTLTNISPPGSVTNIIITDPLTANPRYYRLRSP